jgi:protein-S-isoprenylcysteine O-methyltransferase Ste14
MGYCSFDRSNAGVRDRKPFIGQPALSVIEALPTGIAGRQPSDLLLFGVTAAEMMILVHLTPAFTTVDWTYVLQHLLVLVIALTRRPPSARDASLLTSLSVAVSFTYTYAQVIYLRWEDGYAAWPQAGLVLVTSAACLGLASLLSIGRFFGLRPALRGLATRGPYGLVRHPLYLAYVVGDIGYYLEEWNLGVLLIGTVGWASLLYRIHAEERLLAYDSRWEKYVRCVPYRLAPGIW